MEIKKETQNDHRFNLIESLVNLGQTPRDFTEMDKTMDKINNILAAERRQLRLRKKDKKEKEQDND